MEYKQLTKENTKQIAELQCLVFKGYFLPSLGKKLVYKYFEELFNQGAVAFGAFDGSVLSAFAIFCDKEKLSLAKKRFIKHNFVSFFFKYIGRLLIFDGKYWSRLFGVFKKKEKVIKRQGVHDFSISFLDMATSPDYRRKGLMNQIVKNATSFFSKTDSPYFGGWVLRENDGAMAFHFRQGAEIYGETKKYFIIYYDLNKIIQNSGNQ